MILRLKSGKTVELEFLEQSDGRIDVVAVDKQHKILSHLIGFRKDGKIIRYTSIEPSLGFSLEPGTEQIEDGMVFWWKPEEYK